MRERLQQIDTSAIEDLVRIKKEEDILNDRLQKMDAKTSEVSNVVFQRVRKDYESRLATLDGQARPLKEQARVAYANLRELIQEMEKALDEARLEKEEVEFRRDLGEFAEEEFSAKIDEVVKRLTERGEHLDEGTELRQRFLNAVRSESELETPPPAPPPTPEPEPEPKPEPEPEAAAPAPEPEPEPVIEAAPEQPAPAPPQDSSTVFIPQTLDAPAPAPEPEPEAVPEPVSEAEVAALFEDQGEENAPMTAVIPMDEPAAPAPEPVGATVVFAMPRLVYLVGNEPAQEFGLKPGTTTIGRAPTNMVRLEDEAVSRHHAQVIHGTDGYRIVDLGSKTGTHVNGRRVREQILAEGDIIQVGLQKFIFRV